MRVKTQRNYYSDAVAGALKEGQYHEYLWGNEVFRAQSRVLSPRTDTIPLPANPTINL